MSKEHYIVNCYTCQHNGQETCKGCNTLLVGEDEPYQNWQLREDLEQKDKKIADLQSQLDNQKARVKDLEEENHYKDCQIKKWKGDYENCSKLEKRITKEHQYCLDNWRECEKQLYHQKEMWNELKDWVSFTQPKNIKDEFFIGACSAYSNMKDKMQELEGEKDEQN